MSAISEKARDYGKAKARSLLSGRTGHGGGPCTKRILSEAELAALLALAYQAGRDARS